MQDSLVPKASLSLAVANAYLADYPLSPDLGNQVMGALRSRSIAQIIEKCDIPSAALHKEDYVRCRQVAAFFKKNESLSDSEVCAKAAAEAFHKAEVRCRITNRRIAFYEEHPERLTPFIADSLKRMRIEIARLLGDTRDFLDQLPQLVRLTGGATEDRGRSRALPFLKISRKVRAPSLARPLVEAFTQWMGVDPSDIRFVPVERNRVVFVPKNYKTFRTIAAEPTGLLPFQLAVDSFMKKLLLRWGVDLRDQSANQELARDGSIDGSHATIDLSMASDSLSQNTVATLLPLEWFSLIRRLRCGFFTGREVGDGEYAKFASMGNGLTFVLETLIFTAAVRAIGVHPSDYAVYGDDIVVPTSAAGELIELLRFLGFSCNDSKTFVFGPFRESCGTEWFNGQLVTPLYINAEPRPASPELCHVVNLIVSLGFPSGHLWRLALRIQTGSRLPVVPYTGDTMSGIFIPYQVAQDLGKIKTVDWISWYSGFKPEGHLRVNRGWRSLLVWHIQGSGKPPLWRGSLRIEDHARPTEWSDGIVRYRRARRVYHPVVFEPWYLSSWADTLMTHFAQAR